MDKRICNLNQEILIFDRSSENGCIGYDWWSIKNDNIIVFFFVSRDLEISWEQFFERGSWNSRKQPEHFTGSYWLTEWSWNEVSQVCGFHASRIYSVTKFAQTRSLQVYIKWILGGDSKYILRQVGWICWRSYLQNIFGQ